MAPDLERIIASISHGDQDTVQLLLDSYNTQNAQCFFFNSEAQERKKQQQLEEFKKNKTRNHTPDSDSDAGSDDEKPDLLLRQNLAEALLQFVSGPIQPTVLRACLQTLRILSRDRRALGPMVTECALCTLAHLGGIDSGTTRQQADRRAAEGGYEADTTSSESSASISEPGPATPPSSTDNHCCKWKCEEGQVVLSPGKRDTREEDSEEEEKEEDEEVCRKEAIKALCNIIYNSPRAQERASTLRLLQGLWENLKDGFWGLSPPSGQFYKLRLLFLLTALRPELRLQLQQERGVSVLTKALEQFLAVRFGENCELIPDETAPLITKETCQDIIEILKTLFNIAHKFHRKEPDEEDAALYRRLVVVLRHCMLLSCDGKDTLDELQGHTVNILSALPLTCLDVLLAVPVDRASQKCEGVNMDCVHAMLLLMDRRLDKGQKLKEKLTPVLNLLTESSRVHRETRHYLRQKILPPLRDVGIRPEDDTTLRGKLVRLMTHVDTDVKDCAAELLFVLCKENVSRFVKYTGYGNAAGLLAARGLLNGRRNSVDSSYASNYSSDSDSDTEEYREAKAKINLVTGRVEAEQPDPMEGMTEEEKEEEARRLICIINKLSRDQIIQPMAVTAEGRLAPLWSQMTHSSEEGDDEEELNPTQME